MTRVAIVGVGNMGRNHAHAVSDHPTLVLDSVVDVDADNAAEVAETYGANRSETDAEPAFERADAAIVATPSHAHLEPAEKALDAGLHLLLEKPVSRDIDAARTFANRCYKTDLVTGVSFILRYESAYATVREAARDGDIGDVVAGRAKRTIPMSNSRKAGPGDHPLFYMNIHDVDALLSAVEERVDEVTGYERRGELTDIDIPDAHQVLLRFKDGTIATLEGYGVLPEEVPGDIAAEFELVGTDGTALVTLPSEEVELYADGYDRPDLHYWPVVNNRMDGAVRRQIGQFADAVAGKGEILATITDGVRAQTVAETARRAIEGNRPISPDTV